MAVVSHFSGSTLITFSRSSDDFLVTGFCCGIGLPSNAYQAALNMGGFETEEDYPYKGRDNTCSFKKPTAKYTVGRSVGRAAHVYVDYTPDLGFL